LWWMVETLLLPFDTWLPHSATINCIINAAFFRMLQAKQSAKRGLGNCDSRSLCYIITCPHTANFTMITLATFSWGIMNHPHYSSDLGPIGFQLFWLLKEHQGRHDDQNWLCGHGMSMLLASVPCHVDSKNVPL
jgi:hypothetical protein